MKKAGKILIVDDDEKNVFALKAILKSKGYVLYEAENGKKALEVLNEMPEMDIVLMDMMMPVMDGFETIGEIKKDSRLQQIPIISVTAMAMKGDREICLKAGADDYVTKPVAIDGLLEKIRILLQKQNPA